jgi:uncharacterized membrane protein
MRQLMVKVPQGKGKGVLKLAEQYGGTNLTQMEASDRHGAWELVVLHLDNQKVGPMLDSLESISDSYTTLMPHGVLPLSPPKSKVPEEVMDVTHRSPVEVWLNGLQSIGSWQGFLGYAVAAGIVVWIGLFTNTIFLLVAAMLIAPFAGPAMNVAIATASGNMRLLCLSLVRYTTALIVTVLVTAVLSLLLQQETVTSSMIDISQVSSVAVLLPLVTGAAGALNMVQSENDSLVSGTAVGLLVAASLAPPAGLIGMAAALGEWQMIQNGAFVLLLQLVGINLAGSLVFRISGLKPKGARYQRGRSAIFYTSIAVSMVLLATLLLWQFASTPRLQRSTQAQQAVDEVQMALSQSEMAILVEADLHFTRSSTEGKETLLGLVYVQPRPGVTIGKEQMQQELTQMIQQQLLRWNANITPLIDVTLLQAPSPN